MNLLGFGVHWAVGVETLVVEGLAGGGAYDGELDNLGVVVQAGGFGVENHRTGLRGEQVSDFRFCHVKGHEKLSLYAQFAGQES